MQARLLVALLQFEGPARSPACHNGSVGSGPAEGEVVARPSRSHASPFRLGRQTAA